MPVLEYSGLKIEVDDKGFLLNPGMWNETIARAIADSEGIPQLSKDQMSVINFMRQYYHEFNSFPILRSVCKNIHQPKDCVNEKFIDPMKAWKIAGLPNPMAIESESADEASKIYRMLVPD